MTEQEAKLSAIRIVKGLIGDLMDHDTAECVKENIANSLLAAHASGVKAGEAKGGYRAGFEAGQAAASKTIAESLASVIDGFALRKNPSHDARIMARVVKGDGCWRWLLGHTTDGYARTSIGGKMVLVHRYMVERDRGPIPTDKKCDHLCRHRWCVNPAHIELVSDRTNTLRGDGLAAKNSKKTVCPKGHPYSDSNTWKGMGERQCRTCQRERMRAMRATRKRSAKR